MKKLMVVIILSIITVTCFGATLVKGHYNKKTGKYINTYYKTRSDHSRLNNYSTKGNVNPFTGKKGDKKTYNKKTVKQK
jgi:uncharacterized protein YxeA